MREQLRSRSSARNACTRLPILQLVLSPLGFAFAGAAVGELRLEIAEPPDDRAMVATASYSTNPESGHRPNKSPRKNPANVNNSLERSSHRWDKKGALSSSCRGSPAIGRKVSRTGRPMSEPARLLPRATPESDAIDHLWRHVRREAPADRATESIDRSALKGRAR